MPRVSRRKFVLEMLDTNIRAQTILDDNFESDDEEDVQASKRRRMLSGSDSEESDEDDGPKYPVEFSNKICTEFKTTCWIPKHQLGWIPKTFGIGIRDSKQVVLGFSCFCSNSYCKKDLPLYWRSACCRKKKKWKECPAPTSLC